VRQTMRYRIDDRAHGDRHHTWAEVGADVLTGPGGAPREGSVVVVATEIHVVNRQHHEHVKEGNRW